MALRSIKWLWSREAQRGVPEINSTADRPHPAAPVDFASKGATAAVGGVIREAEDIHAKELLAQIKDFREIVAEKIAGGEASYKAYVSALLEEIEDVEFDIEAIDEQLEKLKLYESENSDNHLQAMLATSELGKLLFKLLESKKLPLEIGIQILTDLGQEIAALTGSEIRPEVPVIGGRSKPNAHEVSGNGNLITRVMGWTVYRGAKPEFRACVESGEALNVPAFSAVNLNRDDY